MWNSFGINSILGTGILTNYHSGILGLGGLSFGILDLGILGLGLGLAIAENHIKT